jgi:hypothetical protein
MTRYAKRKLKYSLNENFIWYKWQIQDFKLGGGHLKKIALIGGRRENCWGISCEKSRFYAKKILFPPPSWIRPW